MRQIKNDDIQCITDFNASFLKAQSDLLEKHLLHKDDSIQRHINYPFDIEIKHDWKLFSKMLQSFSPESLKEAINIGESYLLTSNNHIFVQASLQNSSPRTN